jgi:Na+/glutamate symporter
MPSLFRFLATVGIVAGLIYGGMLALAYWGDPKPREITVSVPPEKFSKQR